jgi:hypothetical protein
MCAETYAAEAKRLRLNELHSKLVIGRGQIDMERFAQCLEKFGDDDVEVATDLLETMRTYASITAGQFHEIEELERGWIGTIYPEMNIMLFFWARAKRAGTAGLHASLRFLEEFRSRIGAIAKIVIGRELFFLDGEKMADVIIKDGLAKDIAFMVADYIEMLLENLPAITVDFCEPSDGLAAADELAVAIGPILDEDLPILPLELCAVDCVEELLRENLLHPDDPITSSGLPALISIQSLGKHVATYGFIALGLPLH